MSCKLLIWADNEAVVQWIRNDSSTITYVEDRVADIREMSNNYQLFHVPTTDNPADFVTRGVKVNDLVTNSFGLKVLLGYHLLIYGQVRRMKL